MNHVDAAENGGRLALVQGLFVRHLPAVRAAVLAVVPNFSRADDIVQETFLTVCRKAGDFEEGSNFPAWACTIARFKAREMSRSGPMKFEPLSDVTLDALASAEPAPVQAPGERLALFEECLGVLAPKARMAMELRYRGECLPEEIARRMGWTVGSVRVALSRARALLRECVEEKLRETQIPAPY